MINLPYLDESLQFVGLIFILWLIQRVIDVILEKAISRKVFEPIYLKALRKFKKVRTRAKPISANFELSFTPDENITVGEFRKNMGGALHSTVRASGGKVLKGDIHWSESRRQGSTEFEYSDQEELFRIKFSIVPTPESRSKQQSIDQQIVGSVGIAIQYNFPFYLLEDTMFNLSSLLSYLEDGFRKNYSGTFSGGRIVICPVEAGLTLDDWIEEEQFDISLLLASQDEERNDSQTEVEFFADRAVVKSSRREIDAKTVKYVRELLLNYYL